MNVYFKGNAAIRDESTRRLKLKRSTAAVLQIKWKYYRLPLGEELPHG